MKISDKFVNLKVKRKIMAEDNLQILFESYTHQKLTERTEINSSGSNRRYFRLKGGDISIIGVIGTSFEENKAFVTLSRHFKEKRLRVPKVLAVSDDGMCYIQEIISSTR